MSTSHMGERPAFPHRDDQGWTQSGLTVRQWLEATLTAAIAGDGRFGGPYGSAPVTVASAVDHAQAVAYELLRRWTASEAAERQAQRAQAEQWQRADAIAALHCGVAAKGGDV